MSFNNANLPSVSNLLAIATKNDMKKMISLTDKSEVLYPPHYQKGKKYNKLIFKKVINICEGRKSYVELRRFSYEARFSDAKKMVYNKTINGRKCFLKTHLTKSVGDHSVTAKECLLDYANNGECAITSIKKKIEKQKYIIKEYEECLDKLFLWNKAIDNKDTEKLVVNKYKKLFKARVVNFLWIIEKWNAKQTNKKRMEFMRPDITHANGRMKIRRKIIEEFERNLKIEKQDIDELLFIYANLSHIKKTVDKIENTFLNAKYNPKTKLGYKFMNDLYDENF